MTLPEAQRELLRLMAGIMAQDIPHTDWFDRRLIRELLDAEQQAFVLSGSQSAHDLEQMGEK